MRPESSLPIRDGCSSKYKSGSCPHHLYLLLEPATREASDSGFHPPQRMPSGDLPDPGERISTALGNRPYVTADHLNLRGSCPDGAAVCVICDRGCGWLNLMAVLG